MRRYVANSAGLIKTTIMAKKTRPDETPEIPEEAPLPGKTPEITPAEVPETEPIPTEEPSPMPDEGPFQPDIPTEMPPSTT